MLIFTEALHVIMETELLPRHQKQQQSIQLAECGNASRLAYFLEFSFSLIIECESTHLVDVGCLACRWIALMAEVEK